MSVHESRVRDFGLLLFVTLLVRFPFFFPDVIDWDESSFILIGQSIVNGHLPYAHLWDIKPPLLFAFFAAAISIFGHTIPAIRFAGALCVAATAWLVYLIVARWWTRSAASLSALLCILGSSLIGSGQATMSEHVMLPALMGATYLWLADNRSFAKYFGIGVLMAMATLVRINMAFAVVAGGLICLAADCQRSDFRRATLAYCAGGGAMLALTCLPFAVAGQMTLLWKSAVLAALARSGSVLSIVDRLSELSLGAVRADSGLGTFMWLGALAGLVTIWHHVRNRDAVLPNGLRSLMLLAAATGASAVMSVGTYSHYRIQLVPFAAIFSAALVYYPPRAVRAVVWVVVALLTVVSLGPVAAEYKALVSRALAHEDLSYGPAYKIAAYLRQENPSGRPVLMLIAHVAHWLNDTEPPTGFVTHPSTLSRENVLAVMGTTKHLELGKILSLEPAFIVIKRKRKLWFLRGDARAWLEATLAADYIVATRIDGIDVYRRTRTTDSRWLRD